MKPRLSILIATVPERALDFDVLYRELSRQSELQLGGNVEFVYDDSPRGALSIGAKRQKLLEAATGDYVVSIDDDDWVPPEYIGLVMSSLVSRPDCVGHYELVEGMAKVPQLSIWTKQAGRWMNGPEARKKYGVEYVRTTFHKTPLKREHALAIGFKDMAFGEDHEFAQRLMSSGRLRTEVFIPRVLYFYRYSFEPHNIKYGIK